MYSLLADPMCDMDTSDDSGTFACRSSDLFGAQSQPHEEDTEFELCFQVVDDTTHSLPEPDRTDSVLNKLDLEPVNTSNFISDVDLGLDLLVPLPPMNMPPVDFTRDARWWSAAAAERLAPRVIATKVVAAVTLENVIGTIEPLGGAALNFARCTHGDKSCWCEGDNKETRAQPLSNTSAYGVWEPRFRVHHHNDKDNKAKKDEDKHTTTFYACLQLDSGGLVGNRRVAPSTVGTGNGNGELSFDLMTMLRQVMPVRTEHTFSVKVFGPQRSARLLVFAQTEPPRLVYKSCVFRVATPKTLKVASTKERQQREKKLHKDRKEQQERRDKLSKKKSSKPAPPLFKRPKEDNNGHSARARALSQGAKLGHPRPSGALKKPNRRPRCV